MELNQFLKGGGVFVPQSMQSATINSGQIGTLLSLPQTAGNIYKITLLSTNSKNLEESMKLVIDGVVVHDSLSLMGNTGSAGFGVTRGVISLNTLANAHSMIYREIYCTSFNLSKVSGSTAQDIVYAYEVGSMK